MSRTQKLDLYKKHRAEYATPKLPILVTVKPALYLTVTGRGEPGGEVFQSKLGALYGVAFTIKMAKKFAGRDYVVCKLEGLWWGKRKGRDFSNVPMDQWNWQIIIRTPDFITSSDLKGAVDQLIAKGKNPGVAKVRLETIDEGLCVQALHVGPYSEEPATIELMKAFSRAEGLSFHGLHHEIYLSDPRRVHPERLRTILRQPVR